MRHDRLGIVADSARRRLPGRFGRAGRLDVDLEAGPLQHERPPGAAGGRKTPCRTATTLPSPCSATCLIILR